VTTARRTRGMSAGLTREAVVQAAESVALRVGVDNTSLRAVASELGVSPTALYHHVSGRDELVDAIADAFVRRILERELPSEPLERVRALVRHLHEAGTEQPGLLGIIIGHVPDDPAGAQITYTEVMLQSLVAAGATETEAHFSYRMLMSLVAGSTLAHANLGSDLTPSLEVRLRTIVDADLHPLTTRYVKTGQVLGTARGIEEQMDFVLQPLSSRTMP